MEEIFFIQKDLTDYAKVKYIEKALNSKFLECELSEKNHFKIKKQHKIL
jgi:hypothetical protein